MWFEEAPVQRVSVLRSQEAIATGARTLATACPFCLNMMTDGMAGTQGGENVKVLDIAELLVSRRTFGNPDTILREAPQPERRQSSTTNPVNNGPNDSEQRN